MEVTEIVRLFDGYMALGLLFWIVTQGLIRFDKIVSEKDQFTKEILTNQQANNAKLMDLLEDLCNVQSKPAKP